jgi:hypothetical protein
MDIRHVVSNLDRSRVFKPGYFYASIHASQQIPRVTAYH